ncbi:MAG: phosphate ABC transporter permease subunit PstC, partial [Pseudomonadota bacterium]
ATLLGSAASVSLLTTFGIIAVLTVESVFFFKEVSLGQLLFDSQWTPLFLDKHFGIWPLIAGTILTSIIALAISVPSGLIIAIYLSEFASERARRWLKPCLELLAGIPTIVYGYFALLFITPLLQKVFPSMGSFNALSAGLAMGIMIVPMVASLSEDAIYTVPRSMREGAYALGASKLQMIIGAVLPGAVGGITAAVILAAARAVGETMIVAIAAGQQPLLHFNPLQPVETMTAYIVQVSLGDTPHGTLEYHTLFAVAMMLFLLTLVLNMISMVIRDRFRRMYR